MQPLRNLAIVASEDRREELSSWAQRHLPELRRFRLLAPPATAGPLHERTGLRVQPAPLKPDWSDASLPKRVKKEETGAVFLFLGPFLSYPEGGILALLRACSARGVPVAPNSVAADAILGRSLSRWALQSGLKR